MKVFCLINYGPRNSHLLKREEWFTAERATKWPPSHERAIFSFCDTLPITETPRYACIDSVPYTLESRASAILYICRALYCCNRRTP